MLGKTFKGLTDEMLAWQTEQLLKMQGRRHGAEKSVFELSSLRNPGVLCVSAVKIENQDLAKKALSEAAI